MFFPLTNQPVSLVTQPFAGVFGEVGDGRALDVAAGQGFHKQTPVLLADQAFIQHDHHAAVALGADKPAKALPET